MIISRVISTALEDTYRRIKALVLGKDDIRTADAVAPYGVDSNPIKDMTAVYADTAGDGEAVIVGYINQDQLAEAGEVRLYSTDNDAGLKTYLWLKANGDILVGGDANHMTQFEGLQTAFNQLKQDFNNLVIKFNTHVHPGVSTGGGSTAVTATPGVNSTADITGAKINKVKTI